MSLPSSFTPGCFGPVRRDPRRHTRARWLAAAIAACVLGVTTPAVAAQHVVARGQTLGTIAKRYNVTVDELCRTNGLSERRTLKPGQRLVIPNKKEAGQAQDGSATKPSNANDQNSRQQPNSSMQAAQASRSVPRASPSQLGGSYTTHRLSEGQILIKLANRYSTTVEQIEAANGLRPKQTLKPGTCLIIPLDPKHASRLRSKALPCYPPGMEPRASAPAIATASNLSQSHRTYQQRPQNAGVVHLVRGSASFQGRVVNSRGLGIPAAIAKVDALLFDRRTHATFSTSPQLLAKLTQVSDYFGGRRIIVVSGYRQESSNRYTARSNHALGRAIDFRVEGVPNEALRDYCHTLSGVGVGYYPNSSFIHLDVRNQTTHWTDVSGPGERPRYTSVRAVPMPRVSSRPSAQSSSAQANSVQSSSVQASSVQSNSAQASSVQSNSAQKPATPATTTATTATDPDDRAGEGTKQPFMGTQ